ncbi:aminotransferase [Pseudomassariella vexata]|uniref:Aminotransferase n=1 Tax=Pseudomassariella vexata TaxID=1141098 RepID=A0A1Y2DDB5_9PEZI|nr:aminotransferase [Pseudomassariella vexata]ORY57273.1 aminotransferase [Pseudomassariella vexata]
MDGMRLFTSLRYDPELIAIPVKGFIGTGWNQKPSAYYMLDFHRDRMLRATKYWGWAPAVEAIAGDEGLKRLEQFLQTRIDDRVSGGPVYVKVILDREGKLDCEMRSIPKVDPRNLFPTVLPEPACEEPTADNETKQVPSKVPEYEILVDSKDTTGSEYTHYKTTNRAMYESARSRAGLSPADKKEVLIINGADEAVMEGSITTPYFWRGGRWVTPPVSETYSPGQVGGGNSGTTRRYALERNLVVEEVVPVRSLKDGEECWISNGVRGFIFGRIKFPLNSRG